MKRWIPVWAIPVLLAMAIGTVWLRLAIVDTTYAINQADKGIRALQREREAMEVKVSHLRSPKRLEELAKSRFNLARPKPDQVVHLK